MKIYDYVKIVQHSNPRYFIQYAKDHDYYIIAAELSTNSTSIHAYNFNFPRHVYMVLGREECCVPLEILNNSDKIYIPMQGIGFCLNTSPAGNIILYEAIKRYEESCRSDLLFNSDRVSA